MLLPAALLTAALAGTANAVTIYTTLTIDAYGNPLNPTGVNSAVQASITGLAGTVPYTASLIALTEYHLLAYNPSILTAPPLPNPMPALNFPVQLYAGKSPQLRHRSTDSFFLTIHVSRRDGQLEHEAKR